MKKIRADEPIDVSTWNLESLEQVEKIIEKMKEKFADCVSEAISFATSEKAHAFFPIEWNFGDDPDDGIGGPAVDDPDVMYISLPLGAFEDCSPHWSISLSEIVENMISNSYPIGHEDLLILNKMRDHFLLLAKKIEDGINDQKP